MNDIVIFTDLDGSLLDHHTYSHKAADKLLADLQARRIPVVPVSSKTSAELLPLRHELDNHHPFIIENGAAVFIPAGYFDAQPQGTEIRDGYWVKHFTLPRSHWQAKIDAIAADFSDQFSQFSSLDTTAIVSLTGLTPAAAKRAEKREFGEPVYWQGSDSRKKDFIETLQKNAAHILQGGRFLHVSGDCDKGKALQWLNAQFGIQTAGQPPTSIAIGDSQNDVAMLEAADYALIIRSPTHEPPQLSHNNHIFLSQAFGPSGWDEGVRKILHSLNFPVD